MAHSSENKRDHSPVGDRPNMSDLRIVLLGKNMSENNRVGNVILNKQVFGKKTQQPDVEEHSERVKGRIITVIITSHMLNPLLTPQGLKYTVSEASPPEPHVIILVLQHNDFSKKNRDRLRTVLNCFGEQVMKHTMILTTDDETRSTKQKPAKENQCILQISTECGGGYLQRQYIESSQILQKVDEIITRNFKKTQQVSSLDQIDMSDLRIVLLGKNVSESNRVGNLILGTDAFESKPYSAEWNLQQRSQRIRGRLKDRQVMIINSPQLLHPHLLLCQITPTVRECVNLSAPGPHVFILVLQHKDFTEEDLRRVKRVLEEFSKEAIKHAIVLTTDEETYKSMFSSMIKINPVHQLKKECGGGYLQLDERKPEWCSEIFKRIDDILKGNLEDYLRCEILYEPYVKGSSVDEEQSRFEEENQERDDGKPEERQKMRSGEVSANVSGKKLNLVLCGSDTTLKVSVSTLLQGKKIKHQRESSEECVEKEEKIHDRLITLVELPALNQLSDEEAMHQTLNCVSLCHPGIHVFLLIITVGPLTDENKAEIEKIQKIFDSKEHFMVLFTTELTVKGPVTDLVKSSTESQKLISCCGGQYKVMGLKDPENSRQIAELLDFIENMKTEPYSLQTYVKAQENRVRHELEKKHKEELNDMEGKIKELEQKIQSDGAEGEASDPQCLRIVLIGKTGNGKSATGNTILGRNEFVSKSRSDSVTTVCMKGVGEVDGRPVAVVDTPGLFDTTLSNDQVAEEIVKCISMSSPGPHVFVIVLNVGRFTKEETDTIGLIKQIFGQKAAQFSIVLFTRGDDLENESLEDYVKSSNNAELKKLIRDCGNRFLAFNNKEKQDKTQVIQLLKMIEVVKNRNQGRYFTNSMFEEAEMSIKKKMEEIMKEREREIQAQNEALKAKYEMEKENMIKRLKEEKQRADEEKVKMQDQFREKEEKLRKEFEEKEKTEQKKRETENQKRLEEEEQQRTEYQQKIEEMKRETENQRLQYEKQQKEREEEDRKREEKYRQDQENMKNEQEHIIAELQMKQEEEIKKRESEKQRRIKEEETERQEWERKIKEAENERKEEIKQQQIKWENEKKQQMTEREENERNGKEKHEKQMRAKQEELKTMRKRFEREREQEQQKVEKERQKQSREIEEKEKEYEKKRHEMKIHFDQQEQKIKEEWGRQKREDDMRREEEKTKWETMVVALKHDQEKEINKRETEEGERKKRQENEQNEVKKKHEEEIKEIKKKHEDQARKQAEEFNEFRTGKDQHVQELKQMLEERRKQQEILEKLYELLQFWEGKELKELQQKVKNLHQRLQEQKGDELAMLQEDAEKLLQEQKIKLEELKKKSGSCVIL